MSSIAAPKLWHHQLVAAGTAALPTAAPMCGPGPSCCFIVHCISALSTSDRSKLLWSEWWRPALASGPPPAASMCDLGPNCCFIVHCISAPSTSNRSKLRWCEWTACHDGVPWRHTAEQRCPERPGVGSWMLGSAAAFRSAPLIWVHCASIMRSANVRQPDMHPNLAGGSFAPASVQMAALVAKSALPPPHPATRTP